MGQKIHVLNTEIVRLNVFFFKTIQ